MNISSNFIIFMHMIVTLIPLIYPLLIKNKSYDYLYFIWAFFLLIHWTFIKGECFLSYLFKKIKDKNYIHGSDLYNDDFKHVFGKYKSILMIITFLIIVYNFYIISKRNNMNNYSIFAYIFLFTFYLYGTKHFKNHNSNDNFLLFNHIIQILTVIHAIYFYKNYINNNIA